MLVALGTVHACAGYSGLHMACVWGRPGCVRELVEGGGDHRLATVHHETPQQLALRYGNSECAEYLSCVGQFPLVFDLHGAGSEGYIMYGVSVIVSTNPLTFCCCRGTADIAGSSAEWEGQAG